MSELLEDEGFMYCYESKNNRTGTIIKGVMLGENLMDVDTTIRLHGHTPISIHLKDGESKVK